MPRLFFLLVPTFFFFNLVGCRPKAEASGGSAAHTPKPKVPEVKVDLSAPPRSGCPT